MPEVTPRFVSHIGAVTPKDGPPARSVVQATIGPTAALNRACSSTVAAAGRLHHSTSPTEAFGPRGRIIRSQRPKHSVQGAKNSPRGSKHSMRSSKHSVPAIEAFAPGDRSIRLPARTIRVARPNGSVREAQALDLDAEAPDTRDRRRPVRGSEASIAPSRPSVAQPGSSAIAGALIGPSGRDQDWSSNHIRAV